VAFIGMMAQLPLIIMTDWLKRALGEEKGKVIGNCTFWFSFTILGQPFAVLVYYYAWQAKYGSVSKLPAAGMSAHCT
jgi:diacylglycerol O-acyltransferase 1